jgi:hypothetical protein
VSLHLRRRGEREDLYPRIRSILRAAAPPPPEPLRALAGIRELSLFVSLTFDSLLADALNAARFGGAADTVQVVYSPNDVRDLDGAGPEPRKPVVFHLLGRASASPDYAICDEDVLEFLHAMQDKQRRPSRLFDELHKSHLLFLGCRFSDWLARFFLRTAKTVALSENRKFKEFLVDDAVVRDDNLTLFLKSFSRNTQVLAMAPADFVAELARRWGASHPATPPGGTGAEPNGSATAAVPPAAIFISYVHEDVEAAGRLAEGLREAQLDVWFDRSDLHLGDDWLRSIRRGIEQCALFLPVVSRQSLSEANRRRFFWNEWNAAHNFTLGMAPDEPFIVPIVIDDTRIDRVAVPDSFKKAQGGALEGGRLTAEVSNRLKNLVKEYHRRQRAGA